MPKLIVFYRPSCPFCRNFLSDVYPKVVNNDWGTQETLFVKINTDIPENRAKLESVIQGKSAKDVLGMKTVPHLVLINDNGAFRFDSGGGANRTPSNVIDFVKGSKTYAIPL